MPSASSVPSSSTRKVLTRPPRYHGRFRPAVGPGSGPTFSIRASSMSAAMGNLRLRFASVMAVALALGSLTPSGAVAMADGARDRATLGVDAVAVPTTSPVLIDGNFDEAVWRDAPVVGDFVQREPTEGAAPTERTEARVAYDDQAVYVAVRAFDREPARITGMLTRRDERSPSDWVRVRHRLVPRSPLGVRVLGQPGRREGRSLLLQRQRQRRQLGRGVGRAGGPRRRRLARRVPHSVLAASLLRRRRRRSGFAVVRELPRANETSSWPLLARSVQGYVSQFGEVNGLRPGGSPKRLELLPYTLGEVVMTDVERRRSADQAHQPGRERRPRPEVRRHAGADRDGDAQPRLRPGGGGSGRCEPRGLRAVLQRAPAVLRRGLGHLPLQHRLQRRRLHRPALLAPHRPSAAGGARHRRRRVHRGAGCGHHPGRREARRAHRRVLGRGVERGDAGGARDHRLGAQPDRDRDRTAGRLQRAAHPTRVRQPLEPGRDAHLDEPAAHRRHAVPHRAGVHGRCRLRLAPRRPLQPVWLLGRQPHLGRSRGDDPGAGERGPLLPAAGRGLRRARPERHLAQRARRVAGGSARSPARSCASTATTPSRARGSR